MNGAKKALMVAFALLILSCYACEGGSPPSLVTGTTTTTGAGGSSDPSKVLIGSFNLQVFGVTKAGKPEVMAILAQIIRHFDLIADANPQPLGESRFQQGVVLFAEELPFF